MCTLNQGRHFNFFLGAQNFFLFFNAIGLLKKLENGPPAPLNDASALNTFLFCAIVRCFYL